MEPLKFLSQTALDELFDSVPDHLERYRAGSFNDLVHASGWAIETTIAKWNPTVVEKLDPASGTEAEIQNSLLIYRNLRGVTPALAREERLWARLCHVECLEFARRRWLGSNDHIQRDVELHFFAPTLPRCRDDNAIGRLWWNGYVASLACPDDIEMGLQRLLSRANIRLQVIDRADTAFRVPLLQGIVRHLEPDSWLRESDTHIAHFMFEVNKRSGGKIFEAMDAGMINAHLTQCLRFAQERARAKDNRH